jgi:hypothetical protein
MTKKDKRTDEELLPIVREMLELGKPMNEIRKELGIGMERLYKLIEMIEAESENDEESKEIEVPEAIEQEVIDDTVKKAKSKIVENLSEKYSKEYVTSMKAAAILKELETRYRLTVESWGFTWEDFVKEAIEFAFNKYNDYIRLQYILEIMKAGVEVQ